MKKILFILGAFSVLFSSCTTKPEYPWGRPDAPDTKPSLMVENTKITPESDVKAKFSVFSDGENVTAESELFIITGTESPIAYEELTFHSNQEGEYTFYAVYNDEVSEKQVVYVVSDVNALPEDSDPASTNFHNRVLLTDFTGTLCQYCPVIAASLQELAKTDYHEKVEVVACHSYAAADPMYSDYVKALGSQMEITAYPSIVYNMKKDDWHSNSADPMSTLTVITKFIDEEWVEKAAVGIAASTHVEEGTIAVNIAVKASLEDTYHVNAFLVEDSIKANQSGITPELEHYNLNIHSHAIRTGIVESFATSNFKGRELGTIAAGTTKTVETKIAYKPEWNLNNCHVVIYVSNPNGVVNTIKTSVTDSVPFDYNK